MSGKEIAGKESALARKTAEIASWGDRQHVAEEQVRIVRKSRTKRTDNISDLESDTHVAHRVKACNLKQWC